MRNKIRGIVKDPATAAALCPTHPIGCKRLCVDTGYYATFNEPHVLYRARPDRISSYSQNGTTLTFATALAAVRKRMARWRRRARRR